MAVLLGDRIRAARERYGISQAELARRIKVSKQSMYLIESNQTTDPGVLKVKAIADVLHVSTDYLLGRTDAAALPPKWQGIRATRTAGGLEGKIHMAEDFDAPLADFADYM